MGNHKERPSVSVQRECSTFFVHFARFCNICHMQTHKIRDSQAQDATTSYACESFHFYDSTPCAKQDARLVL